MRKHVIVLSSLLILSCGLSGCFHTPQKETKDNINSIIEEQNSNILISINYPITHIQAFDRILDQDVEHIYNQFKEEYESFQSLSEESELNIDYTYDIVNERYYNITLTVFLSSSKLAHPITEFKTYVYDKKDKKLLTISDLLKEKEREKLVPKIEQQLLTTYQDCLLLEEMQGYITPSTDYLFTIDDRNLTIYFNPDVITSHNCGIIKVDIPVSELSLEIPLTKDVFQPLAFETPVQIEKVIDPTKPVVALTFDDGPSRYTKEIIDILKEYDANATFFVLGNKVELYQKTIRQSIANGNEIGNHSYNHKQLTKLSVSELKEQIDKTQNILKQYTGYTPRLLRPTYGAINQKIRSNTDLSIVLWNIDPKDWKIKDSKTIANNVLTKVSDRDIILMHDTKKRTVEAVKIIVPALIEQGYQLVTISELEEVKLLNQQ